MRRTALVVCIGNDLVADDGVGPAVYQELAGRELPEGAALRLLGLGGMTLLGEFDGEDVLVVVDAVRFGAAPGTIHVLDWDALPRSASHVSCHGIGIREAVEVSRKLYPDKTPKDVYLVGIEGRHFDLLGEGLSAEVAANVGRAADRIMEIIARQA
jgi:hydrogenase maturation protease